MYQRPVGVWKTSPKRRLLWAAKQVHLYLAYERPERPEIDRWAKRLEKLLAQPVLKFNWERWYRENVGDVAKDDRPPQHQPPDIPDDVWAAWAGLPDTIREKLWKQAAQVRTKAEGLPFDRAAIEYGLSSTMHMIQTLPASERDLLRNVMRVALDEHEGQFGFARRIRQEWAGIARQKAEQIAVTEWNRAASAATYYSYVQQGVDKKAWFTAGDDRVCSICEANSADGEIGIQQTFFSGDLYPPAHPGCRCNISSA